MSKNDGGHIVPITICTDRDEMEALDALGPLMRRAICDSPIRYAAIAVMKQLRDFEEQQRQLYPEHVRHLIRIDPKDPKLDASLARGLKIRSIETICLDRSPEDAELGVKPLVAKYSVKSIREQRRSARRIRW